MVSGRVGDTCPGSYFCPRLGSPQLDHLVWTVNYPLCSGGEMDLFVERREVAVMMSLTRVNALSKPLQSV